MSLLSIFDLSQSALVAQTTRLNTIAENLANAEVVSGSAEDTYKTKYPVFSSVLNMASTNSNAFSVRVVDILEDATLPRREYEPGHPLSDKDGFVYRPNVNTVSEMSNMMAAARSYQTNVEVMNTTKQLLMRTLTLGQ